ncbi:hypothetical protein B0H10DRAFT_1852773, partial [Mycena sp. CBHHK59/15]
LEPLESDLERQVEYDMDEQGKSGMLDAVNAERQKKQLDEISYEVFEVMIDCLEKEWFNLVLPPSSLYQNDLNVCFKTKHTPKPGLEFPSEDSCAICDDSEGENNNAIVFCDGCNVAVHQNCYGVPCIPEGQWLCRPCTLSPGTPVVRPCCTRRVTTPV